MVGSTTMVIGLVLHVLAAIVWVGGMFFAYVVLRPSAGPLEPAVRLALWQRVLSRFFLWVWISVVALLASGFTMVLLGLGGFAAVGDYVRAMMTIGLVMVAIYLYLYFLPWPRFRHAVLTADWATAEESIARIRFAVGLNLILGLITAAIGAGGRYLG
jgi:uncharacterized membrane protein